MRGELVLSEKCLPNLNFLRKKKKKSSEIISFPFPPWTVHRLIWHCVEIFFFYFYVLSAIDKLPTSIEQVFSQLFVYTQYREYNNIEL